MHFPYNNVADFVQRTMLYSSSYYVILLFGCLLYTSDAADERSSVDLGGRRIIKKNTRLYI